MSPMRKRHASPLRSTSQRMGPFQYSHWDRKLMLHQSAFKEMTRGIRSGRDLPQTAPHALTEYHSYERKLVSVDFLAGGGHSDLPVLDSPGRYDRLPCSSHLFGSPPHNEDFQAVVLV